MHRKILLAVQFALVALLFSLGVASAQVIQPTPLGGTFTYQGRLDDNGAPADGNYDFRFTLFNAAAVGTQVGPVDEEPGVEVSDGVFTVPLTFGALAFTGPRWLQIEVRPAGGGAYTTLAPRQQIYAAPAAHYASYAGNLVGEHETELHVSPYAMIQSDGFSGLQFAARINGRMEITRNSTGTTFVYLPLQLPERLLGTTQRLRSLRFCYSGVSNAELGPLAGIREAGVRQVNEFSAGYLLNQVFSPPLTAEDECREVRAETPQPIEGSTWIRFEIVASPAALSFSEITLTLVSE